MKEKLVRDRAKEQYPHDRYRTVEGEEYYMMLLHKLDEEVDELIESGCTDPAEYADVLTVLGALANYRNVPEETIKETAENKILERGGFRKGIVWIIIE